MTRSVTSSKLLATAAHRVDAKADKASAQRGSGGLKSAASSMLTDRKRGVKGLPWLHQDGTARATSESVSDSDELDDDAGARAGAGPTWPNCPTPISLRPNRRQEFSLASLALSKDSEFPPVHVPKKRVKAPAPPRQRWETVERSRKLAKLARLKEWAAARRAAEKAAAAEEAAVAEALCNFGAEPLSASAACRAALDAAKQRAAAAAAAAAASSAAGSSSGHPAPAPAKRPRPNPFPPGHPYAPKPTVAATPASSWLQSAASQHLQVGTSAGAASQAAPIGLSSAAGLTAFSVGQPLAPRPAAPLAAGLGFVGPFAAGNPFAPAPPAMPAPAAHLFAVAAAPRPGLAAPPRTAAAFSAAGATVDTAAGAAAPKAVRTPAPASAPDLIALLLQDPATCSASALATSTGSAGGAASATSDAQQPQPQPVPDLLALLM